MPVNSTIIRTPEAIRNFTDVSYDEKKELKGQVTALNTKINGKGFKGNAKFVAEGEHVFLYAKSPVTKDAILKFLLTSWPMVIVEYVNGSICLIHMDTMLESHDLPLGDLQL